MTDTAAAVQPASSKLRPSTIALWVLQAGLALQFAGAGLVKLLGDPAMVDMFATIGIGQWFRYLVGALELAGAAGLLVPRLAGLAALGLAGVMVGASLTNVFILHANPALPLVLLAVAGLVAWLRRRSTRSAPPSSFS
jgi:uncharacterized membrane protein YphA (DoxX/SURF4 family)